MERIDVCVVGSCMKDLVARAPRRPRPGETLHGTDFAEFLGGKGVNQAVAAARMGSRTALVGKVGDDRYGQEFLDLLHEENIDTRHVSRDLEHGTGVGLPVVEEDGSNSIIIIPRANASMAPGEIAEAVPLISRARVLTVQLELPLDVSRAALRVAADAGVTTILNPAPAVTLDPADWSRVDVLVPNEIEAEALVGRGFTDEDVAEVAKQLSDTWDLRGCVLTLGTRGAYVLDRHDGAERSEWIPAHPVTAVDTVGAGDAFCGALAAGLASGLALIDAARWGNTAGALAVTAEGAVSSMPTRAAVEALLSSS